MSVTTRDGAKLGQTTWRASVVFDDGREPWAETVGSREFGVRGYGLALHFVRTLLAQQVNPPRPADNTDVPRYWGQVQRGTFADNSFEDPQEGFWVVDASWEYDEDEHQSYVGKHFWLNYDGTIDEDDL